MRKKVSELAAERQFPPFDCARLLQTTFNPKPGSRIAILIDLKYPATEILNFAFLEDPAYSIQRLGYQNFYVPIQNEILEKLDLRGGDIFAYQITGGSNLDLPSVAYTPRGQCKNFDTEIYPKYDIFLCISTYSATAPLTAAAKKYGFRGATLHGLNEIILSTGLAVDYREVSAKAEKLRLGMTRSDWAEITFSCLGKNYTLHLELNRQEAQKSHGLCLDGPDVANLPAGEIYFVPTGATGQFPMRYEDGTLGIMQVNDGRIQKAELLRGNPQTISEHNEKLGADPATGELGELGFGTQILPVSGRDIQDEKILGTVHVATGRSDHLGGHLTPDKFASPSHATHDDILFAPHKTPEIELVEARIHREGKTIAVLQNYEPTEYLWGLLEN